MLNPGYFGKFHDVANDIWRALVEGDVVDPFTETTTATTTGGGGSGRAW
jgi:hypothetical protein